MRRNLEGRIAALEAAAHRVALRTPVLHVHLSGSCDDACKPEMVCGPEDAPDLHVCFVDDWKPGDPAPPSIVGGELGEPRFRKMKRNRTKSRRTRK